MNDIGRRSALRQLLAVAGLAGSLPYAAAARPGPLSHNSATL